MTTLPHQGGSKHIRRRDARLKARLAGFERDKSLDKNSGCPGVMAHKPGSGKK